MKKIEEILKDKNVNVEALPQKIQDAIENSKKHYAEWEESNAALNDESTDEEKAEVEELRASVEEFNQSISDVVDDILSQEEEEEEEKPEPKPVPTPAPAPAPAPAPEAKPEEKKKGIGFGAFLLGAAVLVATAGAVNMMRKK